MSFLKRLFRRKEKEDLGKIQFMLFRLVHPEGRATIEKFLPSNCKWILCWMLAYYVYLYMKLVMLEYGRRGQDKVRAMLEEGNARLARAGMETLDALFEEVERYYPYFDAVWAAEERTNSGKQGSFKEGTGESCKATPESRLVIFVLALTTESPCFGCNDEEYIAKNLNDLHTEIAGALEKVRQQVEYEWVTLEDIGMTLP